MSKDNKIRQTRLSILAVTLFMCGFGAIKPMTAYGEVLRVENYGADSTMCGSKDNPCRSLSQAILNARDGDKLLVGPGRYGNLNGDADLDDLGEEAAKPFCGSVSGAGIICVDKRISIRSTHGAAVTVLDAGGVDMADLTAVVFIASDKVRFGKVNGGFSIFGSTKIGLIAKQTNKVIIEGNTVVGEGNTVETTEGNSTRFGIYVIGERGRVTVSNNTVRNYSGSGFRVLGSGQGRVKLLNNHATKNIFSGFYILGNAPHVIRNNVSSKNERSGFAVHGEGYKVIENKATANRLEGFLVGSGSFEYSSSNFSIVKNSAIGNRGIGFHFLQGENNIVVRNNIFGNAIEFSSNCGLRNSSGQTIHATKNYWGANTGPGSRPANNAGRDSICDVLPASTIVYPYSPTPIHW